LTSKTLIDHGGSEYANSKDFKSMVDE